MCILGGELFVRLASESNDRVLHRAEVVGIDGSQVLVRPSDPAFSVDPGTDVLVYFELKRVFMQQSASVLAGLDDAEASPESEPVTEADAGSAEGIPGEPLAEDVDAGPVIALDLLGTPVSAESRQTYRVSTIFSERPVCVDGTKDCALTDVSLTGFSMISGQTLQFAQVVDVVLEHDGASFEGSASVQSVKDLCDGRVRYGFNAVEAKGATLLKGLQKLALDVQREQLRRQARAG